MTVRRKALNPSCLLQSRMCRSLSYIFLMPLYITIMIINVPQWNFRKIKWTNKCKMFGTILALSKGSSQSLIFQTTKFMVVTLSPLPVFYPACPTPVFPVNLAILSEITKYKDSCFLTYNKPGCFFPEKYQMF